MGERQEKGSSIFATGRIFHVMGKGWYFDAREGMHGPYPSRQQAEAKLEILKRIGPNRGHVWSHEMRDRQDK